MMRAKLFSQTCETYQTLTAVARCFTWNTYGTEDFCQLSKCSTWNTRFPGDFCSRAMTQFLFPANPASPCSCSGHPGMFHVEHPPREVLSRVEAKRANRKQPMRIVYARPSLTRTQRTITHPPDSKRVFGKTLLPTWSTVSNLVGRQNPERLQKSKKIFAFVVTPTNFSFFQARDTSGEISVSELAPAIPNSYFFVLLPHLSRRSIG
jgi:hypothetical protein